MNLVQILDQCNLNRPTLNDIGTDKNTIHSYIANFYESEFLHFKDQNISLLEIGVEFGASLKLWSEYFINANSIIGIDIDTSKVLSQFHSDNVNIIEGNAYTEGVANSLDQFDIIIDDASHAHEDHLKLLELYLPKLNLGGVLIIEDIQNIGYLDDFVPQQLGSSQEGGPQQFAWTGLKTKFDQVCQENNLTNLSYEIVNLINSSGKFRYDDLMFVVRAN